MATAKGLGHDFKKITIFLMILLCCGQSVENSCASLDFAPNNFISIDETVEPGTHIFSIPINDRETWTYTLDRSNNVDGSLWRNLQKYFNFKRFGHEYEMIVDKTPDLEDIYMKYSIKLETLTFLMTCKRPGVPSETTELLLLVRPVNEHFPQFIGSPLRQAVPENTPIGRVVISLVNMTIDRDVNPSTNELSVFRLHKYTAGPTNNGDNKLMDSLAYFKMVNLQKGSIAVKEELDYEALHAIDSTRFLLNISAADIHGWIAYTTLQIDVTDVNDLPPEFRHPSCPLHIPRSRPCPVSFEATIPPGYIGPLLNVIPGDIQARDMDSIGADLVLSLDKGPGESDDNFAKFSIDNSTGIVTVASPFQQTTDINLVVLAKEVSALRRTTQAPLKIHVRKDKSNPSSAVPISSSTGTISTSSDINHDGSSDNGNNKIDTYTLFLVIIIGVLSFLVFLLAILFVYAICVIKKENNTRNRIHPSPRTDNLTYTNHQSSYHYSKDDTITQGTNDEFEMPSEMNSFTISNSLSSKIPMGSISQVTETNIPSIKIDRTTETVNQSSQFNDRTQPNNNKKKTKRIRQKPHNHSNSGTVNGSPCRPNYKHMNGLVPGDISHELIKPELSKSLSNMKPPNVTIVLTPPPKQQQELSLSRSGMGEPVSYNYRLEAQQATNSPEQRSKLRKDRPDSQQYRNETIQSPSNDNNDTRIQTPKSTSRRESSDERQSGRQRKCRPGHFVPERRIRIPSGVLIMKQDGIEQEKCTSSSDGSDDSDHSEDLADLSSYSSDISPRCQSGDMKRASCNSDVLSLMPMEQYGLSEDDTSGKTKPLSQEKATSTNCESRHGSMIQDDNSYNSNDAPSRQIRKSVEFQLDTIDSYKKDSENNETRVLMTPTKTKKVGKLPSLNIPGYQNYLRFVPSIIQNTDERPHSDNIIMTNRRVSELKDYPEIERCRSMGDESTMAQDAIRKKKRHRRSVSQNQLDGNSIDVQGCDEMERGSFDNNFKSGQYDK